MTDHATRVRDAAQALNAAVGAARADGYRVDGVGNLDGIAVSETAKAKPPAASHERQGTGFDSGAVGHELQGREAAPAVAGGEKAFRKPKL